MAKADLGIKRACLSCGMKFYDFNRTPIICPGCSTEFSLENLLTSRKGRSAVKSAVSKAQAKKADDVEDQENIHDDEDGDDENAEQNAGIGEEVDNDLDYEEEDVSEDSDGSGIIQDEITEDDELLPNLDDGDEN